MTILDWTVLYTHLLDNTARVVRAASLAELEEKDLPSLMIHFTTEALEVFYVVVTLHNSKARRSGRGEKRKRMIKKENLSVKKISDRGPSHLKT